MVQVALLARARKDATAGLTGRCEIHRYTETRNAFGETVQAWAPVARGVPCRITEPTALASNRERLRLEAIAQVGQWVLVMPWDADVSSRDRIYVTSPAPLRAFDVSITLGPHEGEIRRRVVCDEVT